MAINKRHLTKLAYVETEHKKIMTYAYFDDGTRVKLYKPNKNYFFSKFKTEIEQVCEMKFVDITSKTTNVEDNSELS